MNARIPKGFRTLNEVRDEMGADAFQNALYDGQFEVHRLDQDSGRIIPGPYPHVLIASPWEFQNGEWHGPMWRAGPSTRQTLLVKEPGFVPEITPAPSKNKGGNPGKWDWEGALIEAAVYIYVEGIPDRTDLKKHILSWFSDNSSDGSEPDDKEVRKRVNRLLDAVDQKLSSGEN